MEFEKWEEIKGFNGRYFVSTLGNIKSVYTYRYNNKTKKPELLYRAKILKASIDKQGYKTVNLWNNGQKKTYKIHRLVAKTFIPNPNNYLVINHIDENKMNNDISNLEWCTQKHNILHSVKKLAQRRKIVRDDGKEYESIADALRDLGLKTNHISDVCNGKRKRTGGHKFLYREVQYGI